MEGIEIIGTIYKNRQNFILIGLTGRIGSGCTTAANFLSKDVKEHNLKEICIDDNSSDSKRKRFIIDKFYRKNWKPFEIITMSDIITMFILKYNYERLKNVINDFNKIIDKNKKEEKSRFNKFDKIVLSINKEKYDNLHEKYKNLLDELEKEKVYSLNKEGIASLYKKLKDFFNDSKDIKKEFSKGKYKNYTDLYQLCGDNLRLFGDIELKQNASADNIYVIAEAVNKVIKLIKRYRENKKKPAYIAIDAIRNILEAYYFRERYSAFYLIAINANDNDIKTRLRKDYPLLSEDNIEKQLGKEDRELKLESLEDFASQNIRSCIVNSDIFIFNKGTNLDQDSKEFYGQLIKYICLIQHPGLITPSQDEKMMQIAFTAKLNSGCLSRQVGACVTNKNGSVKSIGWNSVAEGQTPCILRSKRELLQSSNSKAYSFFEKSHKFKELLKTNSSDNDSILEKKGLNDSFCFKSIYTKNNEQEKGNQVHTRALHAEENAFLQLAKYGSGEGIAGGTLYSTASPCELCSKKAYQLGINRIVYIDPYPGIAREQILQSGLHPPKIELFSGAIGSAYYKLYTQIIPFKDELNTLTVSKS